MSEIDWKDFRVWKIGILSFRKLLKLQKILLLIVFISLTLSVCSSCYKKDKVTLPVSGESVLPDDNMVFIHGGTFEMGNKGGKKDEKPVHKVTLSSFYMGKYEVTNKEYCAYDPGHKNPGDNLPVSEINWDEAVGYCKWLSNETGKNYRLPTEAEWEYACRGGTDTFYYWVNTMDGQYCCYAKNSDHKAGGVGQKLPNAPGLYDMSGNLWEWCIDWYGDYPSDPQTDPAGPSSGWFHVVRGGSWCSSEEQCRSTYRSNSINIRINNIGFRLVKTM